MQATPRLLCIMGSGETAPTMVSVHQDLMSRVGSPPKRALLLDTPYGFEENAPGITAKAQNYFAGNVGHPIDVVPLPDFGSADEVVVAQLANAMGDSRYIFAGPGSPSYALNQWRGSFVPALLSERLRDGGCVTFASAAATTLGRVSLPVYEIYKVGERPYWLTGLGIMDDFDLPAAVIPHYDNAQGGTHDTRFCFMGERRLLELERQLDPGVVIMGVAEHTAAVFDRDANRLTVKGRGFAAIRRQGIETRYRAGESVSLDLLRAPVHGSVTAPKPVSETATPHDAGKEAVPRAGFEEALRRGDTTAALSVLLEVEARLAEMRADLDRADERLEFRRMLVRLGEAAQAGLRDPRDVIGPFVELALALRDAARREKRFAEADLVRDHLLALGIEIQDAHDRTRWST